MAPSTLSLHIPLLSRHKRQSQYAGVFDQEEARSAVRNRPISLPLLNAQGNPKQTSITHGTLKHDTQNFMSPHYRSSPLAIERPGAPAPLVEGTGRRRSQTLPVGLPLYGTPYDPNSTPQSRGRYALFPVEQSPLGSPTPTATMPKQPPLTDRQRRALPKPPQQELEHVKKNNAELKEMLKASNHKVNKIMDNLTAEEIRADELENRGRRLEASLRALTTQQQSMMEELRLLRSRLQQNTVVPRNEQATAHAMAPPRKSSKRPKAHAEVLRDDNIQLEIAIRAPKLIGLPLAEKENEEWVHPAHRSSCSEGTSSSSPSSHNVPLEPADMTCSSDASSDVSFRDITASEIEKYCGGGSPSDGPGFWDPAYYEGVINNIPVVSPPIEHHNYIDTLAIMTLDAFPTPPQDIDTSRSLSPIPGTPSPSTTPPLRLNTNLSARQRGIRAAGIIPAPQHRPSNVHLLNTTPRINTITTNSPLARPSGPRPSYAMRKMSMQGHLAQPLQPSPESSSSGSSSNDQANMASTYRPERRPSSIVRALASQGFGMGANGCPLGMSKGLSSATSSESMGGGGDSGSASGGSAAEMEVTTQLEPRLRRTSSAWSSRSSACSPKTLKTHYRWGVGGGHGEVAN